jgi:hypothetical protein
MLSPTLESAGASPLPSLVDVSSSTPLYKIALYVDKLATDPVCIETSWEDFVEFLAMAEESPCTVEGPALCVGKDCPHKAFSSMPSNYMAWSPVVIEGRRLDSNVRFLTLLSLDFDHLNEVQLGQVMTRRGARRRSDLARSARRPVAPFLEGRYRLLGCDHCSAGQERQGRVPTRPVLQESQSPLLPPVSSARSTARLRARARPAARR